MDRARQGCFHLFCNIVTALRQWPVGNFQSTQNIQMVRPLRNRSDNFTCFCSRMCRGEKALIDKVASTSKSNKLCRIGQGPPRAWQTPTDLSFTGSNAWLDVFFRELTVEKRLTTTLEELGTRPLPRGLAEAPTGSSHTLFLAADQHRDCVCY